MKLAYVDDLKPSVYESGWKNQIQSFGWVVKSFWQYSFYSKKKKSIEQWKKHQYQLKTTDTNKTMFKIEQEVNNWFLTLPVESAFI